MATNTTTTHPSSSSSSILQDSVVCSGNLYCNDCAHLNTSQHHSTHRTPQVSTHTHAHTGTRTSKPHSTLRHSVTLPPKQTMGCSLQATTFYYILFSVRTFGVLYITSILEKCVCFFLGRKWCY